MKNIIKLTESLRQRICHRRAYRLAMRRHLVQRSVEFRWVGERRPTRDELHDR
jgi:hypothetical protein